LSTENGVKINYVVDVTTKINENTNLTLVEKVKATMKNKNYVIYSAPYILNIVGIRSKTRKANLFDDKLVVFYTDDKGKEIVKEYDKFTTDPGNKSLIEKCPIGNTVEKDLRKDGRSYNKTNNLASLDGCAVLIEGQYIDTYKKDLHQGKYFALCQRLRAVKVYRDANKDSTLNLDNSKIDEGMFGINIHRANSSKISTVVEDWSAGCQVFANFKDFNEFMNNFVDIQISKGKKLSFTYTLINEEVL